MASVLSLVWWVTQGVQICRLLLSMVVVDLLGISETAQALAAS